MGPISPWCCPTPHCHGAWPVTACVNIVDPLPSATCAIVDHMASGSVGPPTARLRLPGLRGNECGAMRLRHGGAHRIDGGAMQARSSGLLSYR